MRLRQCAAFGVITTNSIAQGDNRSICLDTIIRCGATFYRAYSNKHWPRLAGITVSIIWGYKGQWIKGGILDDTSVNGITSFLSSNAEVSEEPFCLLTKTGDAFRGTEARGLGFVLEPDVAAEIVAKSPHEMEVIHPYLTGEDLNSRFDQSCSRQIINFRAWPKERAALYPKCFQIVTETVKPFRETITKQIHEVDYWKFWDKRLDCYSAISHLPRVLVRSQVGNMHSLAFFEPTIVFSHKVLIFGFSTYAVFNVLQSTLHEVWARYFSGASLRTDMCYSTKRCFDTFVFPIHDYRREVNYHCIMESVGERYYMLRRTIMRQRQVGLTKICNYFHDPDETSTDIAELRRLHVEMDQAVAAAYGWQDMIRGAGDEERKKTIFPLLAPRIPHPAPRSSAPRLDHGFHATKQGTRYTISETARREVLDRLLELNHQRYAEEVADGLHEKKASKHTGAKHTPRAATTNAGASGQLDAFANIEDGEREAGSEERKTGKRGTGGEEREESLLRAC